MRRESRKLVLDAMEAGEAITKHIYDVNLSAFRESRLLRHAVEREFEIIGEALNRLSKLDPATAARISELPKIVSFRNRITHGYDAVDEEAVWAVSQSHLQILLNELRALLKESEPPRDSN